MNILAIFGAGGLGREILELARAVNAASPRWSGYLFINNGEPCEDIDGVGVCSLDEALRLHSGGLEGVVAVGEPSLRKKIFDELCENGIAPATMVHPDVEAPDTARLGRGVAICKGVYLSTNAVLEDNVTALANAVIGHDDMIGEGVLLSALCHVGGNTRIGAYTYVAPGACIREGVTVGERALVAMNAAVFRDVPDDTMVMGNPARPTRMNEDRRVFHN